MQGSKTRFVRQGIRLVASDIREAVAFYRDVLGFTVDTIWGPDADPEGCILDRGDVHLLFHRDDGSEPKMSGVLVIEVDGVVNLHERIDGKAEVLWGPEIYSYGMREFAVRDPNGYRLAFCEPTDDPPTCEQR